MTRRDVAVAGLILAMTSATSACSSGPVATRTATSATSEAQPAATAPAAALTVYAAASLKDALIAVKAAYEATAPGVTMTIATDASSTLRTQIEQGAPADVFLSADQKNPQALVDAGLADGNAVDFAGNTLTVIVPTGDQTGIVTPVDLAKPGVKIVAAGEEVPIARYAKQAVINLASLPGYPTGFAEAYAANVVSKEENVKAVVAKIELGEGDAAIVYVTDAMSSSKVTSIQIPAEANVPATYAGVVVKASARAAVAHGFLDWLAGRDGAAILAAFGFRPPL